MFSNTPVNLRRPSSVTQYGLKPVNKWDFKAATSLVNWGKGSRMEDVNIRRSDPGMFGSAVSFDGTVMNSAFAMMNGFFGKSDYKLRFCEAETASLRICMAKGESDCVRESRVLSSCLGRVQPLKEEAAKMQFRYLEWFRANVSDNFTKPFTHRKHDWQHYYAMEERVWRMRMHGRGMHRYPKELSFNVAQYNKNHPGLARRRRLPVNA